MALSVAIWYFSRSGDVSPILMWILLGINIVLLLAFLIYDYRIKKRKVSKLNQTLLLLSILITVIFSVFIFYV